MYDIIIQRFHIHYYDIIIGTGKNFDYLKIHQNKNTQVFISYHEQTHSYTIVTFIISTWAITASLIVCYMKSIYMLASNQSVQLSVDVY